MEIKWIKTHTETHMNYSLQNNSIQFTFKSIEKDYLKSNSMALFFTVKTKWSSDAYLLLDDGYVYFLNSNAFLYL